MAKIPKYPIQVENLKTLKEINKIISNISPLFEIQENGDIYIISSMRSVDRFAIVKDEYKDNLITFINYSISTQEMRSFLTKYTKTNTDFNCSKDYLYYKDVKKDVSIEIPRSTIDWTVPYNKYLSDSKLTAAVNDAVSFGKFDTLSDEIITKLENSESVSHKGLLLSRVVIPPKWATSIKFTNLDIKNDNSDYIKYRLYDIEYDVMNIYTIVAYLDCYTK